MRHILIATTAAATMALTACGEPADTVDSDEIDNAAEMEMDGMEDDTTEVVGLSDAAEAGGDVTVSIQNIQPGPGMLLVALQTEDEFAQAAGSMTQMIEADAVATTVTFENVPPGEYAAAVVHDTNENGQIDMGATGPTEGWGFSGDAQQGAPEFAPAAVDVRTVGGSAIVDLTYPG
ncbi:MAG: DUF2141 domain-containing protein [Pacificimonas sp.]